MVPTGTGDPGQYAGTRLQEGAFSTAIMSWVRACCHRSDVPITGGLNWRSAGHRETPPARYAVVPPHAGEVSTGQRVLIAVTRGCGLDHKQRTAATVPGVTPVPRKATSEWLRVETPKWGDLEFVRVTDREVRTHKGVEYASGQ